ncbi:MAG: discoidin domain-containing protein [Planctomycetota bacterium]|jgi:hypothetical protein
MFHRSSKRIVVGILIALLLLASPVSAVSGGIIIDPVESCRAERDRSDDNRRSGTKLVVKPSKKSWIKFDLGALDVDHLKTATLMVAAIDDESGNGCHLSVVNDSYTTGIDWTSDDLTWNNAPANDTLSDTALTTDATLVANFAVDGSAGTLFAIDILAVLQADTDGIVQFVLHNSTGGQISFATHDHPEAAWRPFIDATEGTGGQARNPFPSNRATDVPRDVVLDWTPGESVAPMDGHKFYFGESFNDVNDGIAAVTQSVAGHALSQRLDFDTTYYWRIDQVAGAPDFEVFEGEVWSFKTEPAAYPIADVTATASSSLLGQGPENVVNGSGLSDDLHSTASEGMWLSDFSGPQPTWIQFDFGKVYVLDEMWVWNSNTEFETGVGYGAKDVSIEYSVDGIDYMPFGTAHEFSRAPAAPDYAHNTTVDLGDLAARHVRLTISSNWGGFLPQYGLSEVRFLHTPVRAREPYPEPGARGVDIDAVLGWRAGREAATHDVYLSSDEQAVIDGSAPVNNVTGPSFSGVPLDLDTTYYWRVDEVNDAESTATWQGDVWSFTTQQSIVVDDFESYNDILAGEEGSSLVYLTWVDGFENPSANGSTIGYSIPFEPTMESDTVHNGRQSAPMAYNNTVAAISEVTRTLASQNWTTNGVQTLSLWFFGDPANTPGQLYVKINGVKVNYDGAAGNIAISNWQIWNIDLGSVGTDLQSVTSLSIGVDGFGASGTLLLDDIRLYASAPAG